MGHPAALGESRTVSSQPHNLAEHSQNSPPGRPRHHSLPWCPEELLPVSPVSPVDQKGLRGFGGQVLLPSCQHPPAQAAVGVVSSSKRKCRGALAGTGKPCLLPAPSQALPADPRVPHVPPDGPKKAGEPHEGRSPTCPDPPRLWTPIPHASSPALWHPRQQASPTGRSHPPRWLGLANAVGCSSASCRDPHPSLQAGYNRRCRQSQGKRHPRAPREKTHSHALRFCTSPHLPGSDSGSIPAGQQGRARHPSVRHLSTAAQSACEARRQ